MEWQRGSAAARLDGHSGLISGLSGPAERPLTSLGLSGNGPALNARVSAAVNRTRARQRGPLRRRSRRTRPQELDWRGWRRSAVPERPLTNMTQQTMRLNRRVSLRGDAPTSSETDTPGQWRRGGEAPEEPISTAVGAVAEAA